MSVYRKGGKSTWSVCYRDLSGKKKVRSGISTKKLADQFKAQQASLREQVRLGFVGKSVAAAAAHTKSSIVGHIEAYRDAQEKREVTDGHKDQTFKRLIRLCKDGGIETFEDVTQESVERAVGDYKKAGNRRASTCNAISEAFMSMLRWAAENGRIAEMPIRSLHKYNINLDRIERVAWTSDMVNSLILGLGMCQTKFHERPVMLPPADREWVYRLAWLTGLRRGEVFSLTRDSFRLDDPERPILYVAAADSKHREKDEVPLPQSIVPALRDFILRKNGRLFGDVNRKTFDQMFRRDCARAGITAGVQEGGDDKGKAVTFHGLRHGAISRWCREIPNIVIVKELARHKNINTTLRYIHTRREDLFAAVNGTYRLQGGQDNG
jgi:site-specific recombinase XerD